MVASRQAEEFNAQLQKTTSDERSARLKRIFEVRLATSQGQKETRYVLAKSVGWGWLGYHAFLAGHRLAGFVPPVLRVQDAAEVDVDRADVGPDSERRTVVAEGFVPAQRPA